MRANPASKEVRQASDATGAVVRVEVCSAAAGGAEGSVTPATAELNRRIGKNPRPRMLTRSEIDLLRQSAREIAARTREAYGRRGGSKGQSDDTCHQPKPR